MRWCMLMLGLTSLGMAADAPRPDAVQKDVRQLQGTWTVVAYGLEGKEVPDKGGRGTLVFAGDKLTVKVPLANLDHESTYQIHPEKKPKALDFRVTSGPSKGQTVEMIYELEGDHLKMCGGDRRPTSFSTRKDDPNHQLLWVLKRRK